MIWFTQATTGKWSGTPVADGAGAEGADYWGIDEDTCRRGGAGTDSPDSLSLHAGRSVGGIDGAHYLPCDRSDG